MGADSVIRLEDVALSLGRFTLQHVSLELERDEYFVLLGPTGSGKTVLLECLLGIHRPEHGRIWLEGRDVTPLLPEARNIGYIPQDYALFPTMTVFDNIAYGPRVRGASEEEVTSRVEDLLTTLGITHLAKRYPGKLSGGEQQRVAVGRALAVNPQVLLLDEPLAALDEIRRSDLARVFRKVQRQVAGTFVHVCHNLDEAVEVADRVAIIADGVIEQVGTVDEILYRPVNEFVARFTGCSNVFAARPGDAPGQWILADDAILHGPTHRNEGATLAVRPEHIRCRVSDGDPSATEDDGASSFSGQVLERRDGITHYALVIERLERGTQWNVKVPREHGCEAPSVGSTVTCAVPPDSVMLLP